MKTCIKCGFQGNEELFEKNRNTCRKCKASYSKQYRKGHPEETKKRNKKYYEENLGDIKDRHEKYRKESPEKVKESRRKHYEKHSERVKEKNTKYRKENPDKVKETNKKYRQTSKGKETSKRYRSKRRNLGHEPINSWFKGSEAHHLRYSKTHELQNNDVTIYVPRKLHRSILHNGNTGKNMKEINIACLEWYFENTPEEEQNPKAKQLYWNYCTLPEPIWSDKEWQDGMKLTALNAE